MYFARSRRPAPTLPTVQRRDGESARIARVKRLIVFDFDGVIADSETLANTVLAEVMTELGAPMTPEAAMQTFMGKRFEEVIVAIGAAVGRPVAGGIADDSAGAHSRDSGGSFAKSPAFARISLPLRT